MVCDRDCFNCKFPDCIESSGERIYRKQKIDTLVGDLPKSYAKMYREQNKERLDEWHKKWYEAHKEEVSAKRKAERMKKYKNCTHCGKPWHGTAIMYKRKAFCNSECLRDWMLDQGLIKIVLDPDDTNNRGNIRGNRAYEFEVI